MPSPPIRHRLFDAGFRAIAGVGADRWLQGIARGRGIILTFHHVDPAPPRAYAPNAILTITPDFLDAVLATLASKGFEVVDLDSVPGRLSRPATDNPFAVLTFDDGYRDNARHAAPILRRHRVPWTLFVASDFPEGRGRLWWIELERAIGRLDRGEGAVGRRESPGSRRGHGSGEGGRLRHALSASCAQDRKSTCSPSSPGSATRPASRPVGWRTTSACRGRNCAPSQPIRP